MADFTFTLGDVKVGVDIIHVEYDPPQDRYLAASDWDCYGNLEIEWKVVSVEGGMVGSEEGEDLIDEDYIDFLVRKDIMDRINNRDEDY